ncbi:MAG: hypothetical protein ACK5RL_17970 [Acidimicrobiales bacterium]
MADTTSQTRRHRDGPADPVGALIDEPLDDLLVGFSVRFSRTVTRHDLTRAELAAVQRAAGQLARSGTAPGLNEFYLTAARDRADELVRSAVTLLDRDLPEVRAALMARTGRPEAGALRAETRARLLDAVPSADHIDQLGRWWHRRLRLAASVRYGTAAVRASARGVGAGTTVTGEIDSPTVLGSARPGGHQPGWGMLDYELRLLDRAPWGHGDRLLAAFEHAHAELRRQTTRRIVTATVPWPSGRFGAGAPPERRERPHWGSCTR